MSKKKIKLFFEDTINLNRNIDTYYSQLIISHLDEKYELSEDFGKVEVDSNNIIFSNEIDEDNELVNPVIISPIEDTLKKNMNSSWSLPDILGNDEIPFFVIDTDGLKINNITKLLDFGNEHIFSYDPRVRTHGRPDLLSCFLSSTYKFQFENWGLVLVNPNKEVISYKSLKTENTNLEKELFSKNIESSIGLAWLYKGNKKKKAFFSSPKKDEKRARIENKAIWQKVVQEIWFDHPQIKEQFSTAISVDISEFNKNLIPIMDRIDKRLRNPRPIAEANASNTILSLYLRKTKKNPGDNFRTINKKVVNKKTTPDANNLEIIFFEFGNKN